MALKWSFSKDRCFRRCQRQLYFREIAAWHNARDPFRREAFIRKQAKGLELWRGLLVHAAIENDILPRLSQNVAVPWQEVTSRTLSLAERQFDFSRTGKYREAGMSKTKGGDAYCVLLPHLRGEEVSDEDLQRVHSEVEQAFTNLSQMDELWRLISGRGRYFPELMLNVNYADAVVQAKIDLLCFRGYGKPIVVEWKTYSGDSGGEGPLQTALYGWMLRRSGKWAVESAADVVLLEAQLLSGDLLQHRCDDGVFEELEDKIYRGIEEMRALIGDGDYADQSLDDYAFARSHFSCVYCPFRDLCLEPRLPLDAMEPQAVAQGTLF